MSTTIDLLAIASETLPSYFIMHPRTWWNQLPHTSAKTNKRCNHSPWWSRTRSIWHNFWHVLYKKKLVKRLAKHQQKTINLTKIPARMFIDVMNIYLLHELIINLVCIARIQKHQKSLFAFMIRVCLSRTWSIASNLCESTANVSIALICRNFSSSSFFYFNCRNVIIFFFLFA